MKQARGETRKLLVIISELQGMIGMARGLHYADTDPHGFENAQKLLDKAFELCVQATSPYFPVDTKEINHAND